MHRLSVLPLIGLVAVCGTSPIAAADPPPEYRIVRGHSHAVVSLETSPDGKRAASVDSNGTVHIRDLETGRLVASMVEAGEEAGLAFTAGGRQLVTCSKTGRSRLWNAETGDLVRELTAEVSRGGDGITGPGGGRPFPFVAAHPSEPVAAIRYSDGRQTGLLLIDLETGDELTLLVPQPPRDAVMARDRPRRPLRLRQRRRAFP